MFGILSFLAGSIFVGKEIISELRSSAADMGRNTIRAEYEKGRDEWREKFECSLELWNKTAYMLRHDDELYKKTMGEVISKFGLDFEGISRGRQLFSAMIMYLVALQGKTVDVSWGIIVPGALRGDPASMKSWNNKVNFIRWIDKQLKKHGDTSELKFIYKSSDWTKELTDSGYSESIKYKDGRFIWDAMIENTYRLKRISEYCKQQNQK